MKKFKAVLNLLPVWLTLVFVITLLCGLIYASVQQSLRQGANDPQIQIAEDLADRLNPLTQIPNFSQTVDLKKSLSTFVIIYNHDGKPITSTAYLDNQIPSPPIGVFQNAEKNKENRVTWEPQDQIRIAAVIVPFGNQTGFILAGRSLREVEKRVDRITAFTFIIWLVSIIGSFIVLFTSKLIFL
jgi:sensor histidine kinase regulating citrate/malate metabolism